VGFWTLIVGALGAAAAVLSGLQAEESIDHGDAVHRVMETHELLAFVTLGIFAVLALWRVVRQKRMGTAERSLALAVSLGGVGVLIATAASRRPAGVRARGRHSHRGAPGGDRVPWRRARPRAGEEHGDTDPHPSWRGFDRAAGPDSGAGFHSGTVTRPPRRRTSTQPDDPAPGSPPRSGCSPPPAQQHAAADHPDAGGGRHRDPAAAAEATRNLAAALEADSLPPAASDPRCLHRDRLARLRHRAAHGAAPDRHRRGEGAWADPGRPGNSLLIVETLYRPLADPSLPERELEHQVPRDHPTALKVERILEAMLSATAGRPDRSERRRRFTE
jgi:hypothetical protein